MEKLKYEPALFDIQRFVTEDVICESPLPPYEGGDGDLDGDNLLD